MADELEDPDPFKPEWQQVEEAETKAILLEEKFCTVGLTRREFLRLMQLLRLANQGDRIGHFYQANNIPPGDS